MQSSSCSGKWSLPVMLIVDLSLVRVVQHSPFQFFCLAYTRVVSQIDGAVRAYAHAHDDHYLTRSKFNSLLTEMITPQIYIQVYYIYTYKTASCTSCIRGSLRLAPNNYVNPQLSSGRQVHDGSKGQVPLSLKINPMTVWQPLHRDTE